MARERGLIVHAHDPDAASWPREVISFWFDDAVRGRWFGANDAQFDLLIRDRFGVLYRACVDQSIDAALASTERALATIIVLDQFPRNMFRGTPEAFAQDGLARAVAAEGIARGLDRELSVDERLFFYLPFEHSEDLADQERVVALIEGLGNADYTRFAVAHRDIIARFGRFPHRNAILGRTSSDAEKAFLLEPGSSF